MSRKDGHCFFPMGRRPFGPPQADRDFDLMGEAVGAPDKPRRGVAREPWEPRGIENGTSEYER